MCFKENIMFKLCSIIFILVLKLNKTAQARAKPLMFRLPFKVYGAAVITKKIK